jgi:periplasmic protein TonB
VLKRRRDDYVDLSYGRASYGVHRGALLLRRSHEESGVAVSAGLIGIAAQNDYLMPLQQPARAPSPAPEATASDPGETTRNSPAGGGIVGGQEGEGGGADKGVGSGAAGRAAQPAPPRIDEELRRSLMRRYLDRVLRPKIAARFTYPREAARRNLEGNVVVRIAISGSGSLVGARIAGPCPAVLLCEAAVDVIRRAAPFAPPPPELESPVEIEVPLEYNLD